MKMPRLTPKAPPQRQPEPTRPSSPDRKDDPSLGVRHQHDWAALTARPRLQSAHDSMRWDVAISRILLVRMCTICGEPDRSSVEECNAPNCTAHPICERPYR
jgi:hypothetical protein